jgi:LAGLIDADG-like domain
MATNIPWTEEDHVLLLSVINKGKSLEQIRKEYFPHRTYTAIQSRLFVFGFKNNYYHRKYNQDEFFWSEPNEANSYWAGVMAADGHISLDSRYGTKAFQWIISTKDESWMDLFMKTVGTNVPKKYIETTLESGNISRCVRIRVASSRWVKDLEDNFKIINNKSARLDLPEFKEEKLLWCFIRGYIDGDGHITHYKGYGSKRTLRIGMTSESIVILEKIMELIDNKFTSYMPNRKRKLFRFKTSKAKTLYISGQKAVQMFLFLSKFGVPCLDRKWKNPEVLELVAKEVAARPEAYKDFI